MSETIKRMGYGKEYLNWWYNEGGMRTTMMGLGSVGGAAAIGDKFAKAVGPWDAPSSPYNEYFESVFSAKVQAWVTRSSEVFSLIRKTTYIREGDSIKYYEADPNGLTGFWHTTTPYASGSAESGPTVIDLEKMYPAFLIDPWETSFVSRSLSTYQNQPKLNPQFVKDWHTKTLPNKLDLQLTQSIDTLSNDGSSNLNMESIDRIIASSTESSTTFCDAATDGDLHWGNSSALVDRDADTDDTFGGGAGSGINLPTTAAARVLDLGYIDDAFVECSAYSDNNNYIMVMGPKTLNEVQKLIDPKERYAHGVMQVQYTMNGVKTRRGHDAGFQVASYVSNGTQMPIFPTRHAANELAANRSGTVTDADIGNIYMIDLDEIEIRTIVPITYMETPPPAMLTADAMKIRHAYIYGAQLLATDFQAHGAVKYLKST